MRSFSVPAVSNVIVLVPNSKKVSVSPLWMSLSVIFNPLESIRKVSVPPISAVIISLPANLIAVSVSPVCTILSAISTSPVNVPVVPDTAPLNDVAVTIPLVQILS